MFRHPAWAVGSHSNSQTAAGTLKTKSTGGFYHSNGSPCTWTTGPDNKRGLDEVAHSREEKMKQSNFAASNRVPPWSSVLSQTGSSIYDAYMHSVFGCEIKLVLISCDCFRMTGNSAACGPFPVMVKQDILDFIDFGSNQTSRAALLGMDVTYACRLLCASLPLRGEVLKNITSGGAAVVLAAISKLVKQTASSSPPTLHFYE